MEVVEGYRGQAMRAEGYVKEFTRHSNDVLLNLNELRHRSILTDTILVVGNVHLRAHCAVLVACRSVQRSRRCMLRFPAAMAQRSLQVSSDCCSLQPRFLLKHNIISLFLSPHSGFFYSLYSRRVLHQGRGGSGEQSMTVNLPNTLDPSCVSLLLDFMYTSRLPLTPSMVSGVLAVAAYLQMDHVADTCRDFMQLHW